MLNIFIESSVSRLCKLVTISCVMHTQTHKYTIAEEHVEGGDGKILELKTKKKKSINSIKICAKKYI